MLLQWGILFICILKGRSCTYLDVKNDIELFKIPFQYSSIPVVHSTVYTLPFCCEERYNPSRRVPSYLRCTAQKIFTPPCF